MTDIFQKEKIQVDDLNPASPVAGAVDDLGQPTARPSGQPDLGGGADKINAPAPSAGDTGVIQDALPPDTSTPRQMGGAETPDMKQPPSIGPLADNQGPEAHDIQPPAAPTQITGPKDIFASEGIAPPSAPPLQEINQAALNPPQTPEVQQYVQQQQSKNEDIASHFFSPAQIADFKANPINLSNITQMGHLFDPDKVLPGANMVFGTYDAIRLNSIQQNIQGLSYQDAMHKLSINDQQLLTDIVKRAYEIKMRGFAPGFSGGASEALFDASELPAWITQFAAGGMIGTGIKAAAGLEGAGAVAAGAASRIAPFLPTIYNNATNAQLNESLAITDKGQMFIQGAKDSFGSALMKSFAYTGADIASQVYGGKAIEAVAKTPLTAGLNLLPTSIKQGIYNAYAAINPSAQVSKALTVFGWNGVVEQLGINRIDQILHAGVNAATTPDYNMKDFVNDALPSDRQLAIEAGLLAIPAGISASGHAAVGIFKQHGMDETTAQNNVQSMSENDREAFVNKNIPLPSSDYPMFGDQKKTYDFSMPTDGQLRALKPGPIPEVMADGTASVNSGAEALYKHMANEQTNEPPPIADNESFFNKMMNSKTWKEFYSSTFNELQAIEDLGTKAEEAGAKIPQGQDPRFLLNNAKTTMGLIDANIQFQRMYHDPETGDLVKGGKALKSIYDDFDNTFANIEPDKDVRHGDFHDYQTARSQLELAEKRPEYYLTDEQKQNYLDNVQALSEKYGKEFPWFETFAKENREWRNAMVYNHLVRTGLKSEEWYSDLVKSRELYAPGYRVFPEEDQQFNPSVSGQNFKKDPNANRIGSMKQATGSKRDIKNVFMSDVKNAAQMVAKGEANRLLLSMEGLKEYHPDDITVSNPKVISGEVKSSFDPKLRAKLEALVSFLGGKTERQEKVKVDNKSVLGSYTFNERLVQLKLGSTEGTLAHEAGHMLDDVLHLKEKMLSDPEIKSQLQKLAEDRLVGPMSLGRDAEGEMHFREELEKAGTQKYRDYITNDREILANMFDAFVNSPDQLKAVAPKALEAFEKIIAENKDLALIHDIKPSTSRAEEVIQKPIRDLKGPEGSLPFYKDGKRKFLEVSPDLQKAFKGFNRVQYESYLKYLDAAGKAQKKLLQIGATSMPGFMLRHPLRGMQLAFVNTYGKATPIDFAKSFFQVLGSSDQYKEWKAASGGLKQFAPLDDASLEKYMDNTFKTTIEKLLSPSFLYKSLKSLMDHPARLAVFTALKRDGVPENEAALRSLSATLDYSRSGSAVKRIGRYSPFLNVEMQNIDSMIKTFKNNPKGYIAAATAMWTVPQMLVTGYYLYAADDKTRKEYLELSSGQRFLAMNIKVGDHWIPFPRAFTPAYIFGSMPEQAMIHLYGKGAPGPSDFFGTMVSGLVKSIGFLGDPSASIPPVIKALVEGKINYNLYFASHLYPTYKENMPPSMQTNNSDTNVAKWLGKEMNISPAAIDNFIQETTGNLGKYIAQNFDAAGRDIDRMEGKKVNEPPSGFENSALSSGVIERKPTGFNSQDVQTFYDRFDKANQAHTEFNSLKNDGPAQSEYKKSNKEDLKVYDSLNGFHKDMAEIDKEIKTIHADANLSGDQKQTKIDHLSQQMTTIANHANLQYLKVTRAKQ